MEIAGVKKELLNVVSNKQLKFLGHLLRHECLQNKKLSWENQKGGELEEDREPQLVRVSFRVVLEVQRWPDWCGWRKIEKCDIP